ncbi:uncharacterized protein SCODWIG_03175 [Saccharomycodes ludwigii]|uniref:Protein FMP25, mitochondrial n=1 Tax=Saccharomycodes ludwigii TaxID=36035 RepID=A0A376BA48_9ASCO|nr:hypothetical protein SCDLUD_000861 [Saccharomycodes ludwigii]KAH3903240.1 hypothetical protein SCDLUD_000861 [Saccharomycodes ludwigii]SSD61414.1 uncharacterized protein SCODWIG_03175 [Saccharomycodes ludwigii]
MNRQYLHRISPFCRIAVGIQPKKLLFSHTLTSTKLIRLYSTDDNSKNTKQSDNSDPHHDMNPDNVRYNNYNLEKQTDLHLKRIRDKIAREKSVDESEVVSSNITTSQYFAKKPSNDNEVLKEKAKNWGILEDKDAVSEKEYERKMERILKIQTLFQGLLTILIVGGIIAVFYNYTNWFVSVPALTNEQDLNKKLDLSRKTKGNLKRKNRLLDVVNNEKNKFDQYCTDLGNGIMIWENGKLEFINGLKDVIDASIANDKIYVITKRGDLYEGGNNGEQPYKLVLKDQKLTSCKFSNHDSTCYAMNRHGEILIIPLQDKEYEAHIGVKRSILLPWKKYWTYDYKLSNDQYSDYDTGKEHLVCISKKTHKAYSCSTVKRMDKLRGQLGLPEFSPILSTRSDNEKYPQLNELYDIELLNNSVVGGGGNKTGKVTKRNIKKVSCGDYHTLALDDKGAIYSFGNNRFGQLGFLVSYDLETVAFPRKLNKFPQLNETDESGENVYDDDGNVIAVNPIKETGSERRPLRYCDWECTDIECCGNTSYATMLDKNTGDYAYFSFGNGINGQLGTGVFKHTQSMPSRMKFVLNNNSGHHEDLNGLKVNKFYMGNECGICTLAPDNELYVWGSNLLNGVIGVVNGKRFEKVVDTNLRLPAGANIYCNGKTTIVY